MESRIGIELCLLIEDGISLPFLIPFKWLQLTQMSVLEIEVSGGIGRDVVYAIEADSSVGIRDRTNRR